MYYTGAVHKTRDAKKGQNPPPPPPPSTFFTIEKGKYHTVF